MSAIISATPLLPMPMRVFPAIRSIERIKRSSFGGVKGKIQIKSGWLGGENHSVKKGKSTLIKFVCFFGNEQ